MGTQRKIDAWIDAAKATGAKYLISVTDTFDYDDYPVYVMPDEDLETIKAKHSINMRRINEVIEINYIGNVVPVEVTSNIQKARMIADQCRPCTEDFYSGILQGVKLALEAERDNLLKAESWDKLDEKIGKFYAVNDSEDNEKEFHDGLCDIGELAATTFGYM